MSQSNEKESNPDQNPDDPDQQCEVRTKLILDFFL